MRLARQAGDVPVLRAVDRRGADLAVGALADDVELALERQLVGERRVAADEHLAHERLARLARSRRAMQLSVGTVRQPRTVWPSDSTIFSNTSLSLRRWLGLRGRKTSPPPYSPGPGSVKRSFFATCWKKRMRHLDQDAGAVAGVGLAAAGAAVVEIAQHLNGLLDDAWDLRPFMSTTKPTPQASCSNAGSYRPCLPGWPGPTARGGGCRPVCRRSGARSAGFFSALLSHGWSPGRLARGLRFSRLQDERSQCRRPLGRDGVRSWINSGLEAGGRFAGAGAADPAQGARLNHQYEPDSTGAGR